MDLAELVGMNLHDVRPILGGKGEVIRVPEGWIYRLFQFNQTATPDGQWIENYIVDSVFVPQRVFKEPLPEFS